LPGVVRAAVLLAHCSLGIAVLADWSLGLTVVMTTATP
jgi:hypothetical protein